MSDSTTVESIRAARTTNRRSRRARGRARDHGHRDLVDHVGAQPLDELADRRLVGHPSVSAIRQNRRRCSESETSRTSSHSPSRPSAP